MLEGLRTAAAGMAAQQQKLDAVANDLANANTTGYKHVRVGFADLLYNQAGRPSANGVDVGTGVRAVQAGRGLRPGGPGGAGVWGGAPCARPASRWTSPSRARASSRSGSPTAVRRSPATAS